MKAWIALLVSLLLMFSPALAEGPLSGGPYRTGTEEQAWESGLQTNTITAFAWGGLPLLDEKENQALASLLDALKIQTRAQGAAGNRLIGVDVLLQNVSVLDLSFQTRDGVLYEQSSLLGGRTVSFTAEEFGLFIQRWSEQSGGAVPKDLAPLFETVHPVLEGWGSQAALSDTLNRVIQGWEDWGADTLVTEELLYPEVSLPGVYGARAMVKTIARGQALSQYREVYDLDGVLAARQVQVTLADGGSFLLEWTPGQTGAFLCYAEASSGENRLTALITAGPESAGKASSSRQQNRLVAEVTCQNAQGRTDLIITNTQTIETGKNKETVTTHTEWMMQSSPLLGDGEVLTLVRNQTDTASGAGRDYTRKRVATYSLKGLGFDNQTFLTVTANTVAQNATEGLSGAADVLYPVQMDDEAFAKWLADAQAGMSQAMLSFIGRLPQPTAEYLLGMLEE